MMCYRTDRRIAKILYLSIFCIFALFPLKPAKADENGLYGLWSINACESSDFLLYLRPHFEISIFPKGYYIQQFAAQTPVRIPAKGKKKDQEKGQEKGWKLTFSDHIQVFIPQKDEKIAQYIAMGDENNIKPGDFSEIYTRCDEKNVHLPSLNAQTMHDFDDLAALYSHCGNPDIVWQDNAGCRQALFMQADQNLDGTLDKTEIAAFLNKISTLSGIDATVFKTDLVKLFDTNRNGSVELPEIIRRHGFMYNPDDITLLDDLSLRLRMLLPALPQRYYSDDNVPDDNVCRADADADSSACSASP